MARPARLDAAQVARRAADLAAWTCAPEALRRRFDCADFRAAFDFMQAVAREAERLDHHPDWRNVYARVEIALSTHDAGGVTELDFALAEAIDRAWAALPASARRG